MDWAENIRAVLASQRALCARVHAEFEHALPDLKVGISRELLAHPRSIPVRGLRNTPTPTTTGWFLWSGEMTDDPDFFLPLHLGHIWLSHAHLLPYLGMSRGWCFIVAPGYEDIWYEPEVARA